MAVVIFGEVRMGAQRWIDIPGFGSVQPSEFMKIGMPMMIACFYHARHYLSFSQVDSITGPDCRSILLIAEQPDLGTSLLVLASGIFVLFLSGLSWR